MTAKTATKQAQRRQNHQLSNAATVVRLLSVNADLLAAMREVAEEVDGREDIDNHGNPNLAMTISGIARAAIARAEQNV